MTEAFSLYQNDNSGWTIAFKAMASPCEVIFENAGRKDCQRLGQRVLEETRRIERKFSRYLTDSVVTKINTSAGKPINIDQETYRLFLFAKQCYLLSDGMFDITSGVFRQVWKFDGSDNIPSKQSSDALLAKIGWEKLLFDESKVVLPAEMEIDFGGIGKEYAVDRVVQLLKQAGSGPALVNFGGDLATTSARGNAQPWRVGIDLKGLNQNSVRVIEIQHGAIATSGDANRYLLKDGKRYSHILSPKTGRPIEHAASSITVAANTCIEAGITSTLAMLQGADAEAFLEQTGFTYWLYR